MKLFSLFAMAALFLMLSCSSEPADPDYTMVPMPDSTATDSVVFSFVFVGCNRIDWTDTLSPNTDSSTANLPQLLRTYEDVCALEPQPDIFFFLGDLVLGLDSSEHHLERQLVNWVEDYHNTDMTGISATEIKMIAVPGNHEMLYYTDNGELPWEGGLDVWMETMADFMPDQPINAITGPDSLVNRQTYSFDYMGTHFIMMNTDTYHPAQKIGQIPADWIAADIAQARANGAEHIFLMGHKPSYIDKSLAKTDKRIDTTLTNIVWPVMEANQAEAMLSAHSHQYWRSQPNANSSYQIVAGNGGSPYTSHLTPAEQFFGYTQVRIMSSGKVLLTSHGRDIPADNYLETIPDSVHTTVKDSIDISWGTSAAPWQ